MALIHYRDLISISCFAALPWIACGGNVVVDSAAGSGGGAGNGAGGASTCDSPHLVGDVSSCSAPDDPAFCIDWTLCDTGGQRWRAKCDETACHCLLDDVELCACPLPAPPCGGAGCCDAFQMEGIQCCPYPWIEHPGCVPVGEPCTKNADCCYYSCTNGYCDP